jgi:hypothetical protein
MMMYNKSEIMKRAWEIYRTLTGDRIAKLSYAMKQAWAEAKTPSDEIISGWNITKLEEAGATRWTKYGKDRMYLSRIGDALMGLELDFYKSGNICSAWLNNEKISNRESFRVSEAYSRAYIDLASGKVYECVGRYADDFMDKLNVTFRA